MTKKSAREKQLDTLLRIRQLEEDLAKGELASANAATRTAYRRLVQSHERYQREVSPLDSCDVERFRAQRAHSTATAAMVRGAERGIQAAEEDAAQARQKVTLARVKSQGLERLVERVQVAAFTEMLAADQRAAEESSASIRSKGRR